MTSSRGLAHPHVAASSLPARRPDDHFGSTLVGWLIQMAFISVVERACETYYESRGSSEGLRPGSSSRLAFPFSFYQHARISRALGRESKLSKAGYVAGQRRRWRAVSG
jgi:hypothetical protein